MVEIKKILFLLISLCLLTGCGKNKSTISDFKNVNNKHDTYEIKGSMKIISNEDEFVYDLTVDVLENKYYKVSLINTLNKHEQIILKNDDGVYVVTPELNKSFKFNSDWPKNGSQAYIIGQLVTDVSNDANAYIENIDGGYRISSSVNYPNNEKLDKEIITTDKDYNIKSVEVLDQSNNVLIKVEYTNIDYNKSMNSDMFKLSTYTSDKTCTCVDEEKCECEKPTSSILDEIIYPLYVPTDTYLSSKDTVNTETGNRVILTFSGNDPFILVEEDAKVFNEMEIIPVNGEPLILGGTIGAISDNSLTWWYEGVDYYLTSNDLNRQELMTIAESITNGSTLVASTK